MTGLISVLKFGFCCHGAGYKQMNYSELKHFNSFEYG
jgi:hypothetical protein